MGCNCKRTFDKMKKYSDDYETNENRTENFIYKLIKILSQIFFGIFTGCIVIIIIVPMLLYLITCLIFGKELSLNLSKIIKRKKINGK